MPGTPKGSASTDEYRRGLLAVNGISLCFGCENMKKLCDSNNDKSAAVVPIGIRLLKDRSSFDTADENVDYYSGHQQVEKVASQINRMLIHDTRRRGWKRLLPLIEQPIANNSAANNSDGNAENAARPKRKRQLLDGSEAEEPERKKKRWPSYRCCVRVPEQ